LSSAHQNLGDLMGNPDDLNLGERPAAISHYREAVKIDEALAASDLQDLRASDGLASTYRNFGAILLEDQPAEALKLYEKATALSQRVSAVDPTNTKYRRDIALGQAGIGESLHGLGRDREALTTLTGALESINALAAADPTDIPLIGFVGRIHREIGNVLLSLGDMKGALDHYMLALDSTGEPIRRAPANLYYQRRHADAVESLGRYYAKLAEHRKELKPDALQWLEKSLAFWKDWVGRGLAAPYAGVRERQVAALIASVNKL
jgi:tetratricopeptide (TPR) repeat protein